MYGGIQLVQHIHGALGGIPHKVARAGFVGSNLRERGFMGGQPAVLGIKTPGRKVVAAQAGGKHMAVGRIGVDGVRVGRRGDELLHRTYRPILANAVDRDLVAGVGRRKQPAPRGIGVDVGHAVGQGRLADLAQLAAGRVDGQAQHPERL
ncbi:hypothetical protein D3C71_1270550 [compost metagenome]